MALLVPTVLPGPLTTLSGDPGSTVVRGGPSKVIDQGANASVGEDACKIRSGHVPASLSL